MITLRVITQLSYLKMLKLIACEDFSSENLEAISYTRCYVQSFNLTLYLFWKLNLRY